MLDASNLLMPVMEFIAPTDGGDDPADQNRLTARTIAALEH